jgi:arylsulfatase A-like enzyme
LRPDMLDFFSGEAHTPFMDEYLAKATIFNEAITPLARTYPSWVGILTGQYPLQSGARTNLAGVAKATLTQTLPALLRNQGYETFYATDETRFSNIDNRFGFDASITPPIGLNDFLLGTFNDFPLSNLIVNSAMGRWLFPYSYANRPAYATYDPNSFLNLLRPTLLRDHHKPLFFAVHFCLPHHPYLYAQMSTDGRTGQQLYLQSIQRVDLQLQDFFTLLQQAHLLDHAVVVLLSDHGEALELHGDRLTVQEAYEPNGQAAPVFYPRSEDMLTMDQSVGHGTDILGLPQYHSLLAFRLYGLGEQAAGIIPGVVSLLDIKPTILALVPIASSEDSGRELGHHSLRSSAESTSATPRTGIPRIKRGMTRSYLSSLGLPSRNSAVSSRDSAVLSRNSAVSSRDSAVSSRGLSAGSISLAPQIKGDLQHTPPNRMLFLESDFSPDALRTVFPETRKLLLEGVDLFQIDSATARLSVKKNMLEMIIKSKQYAVIYDNWMLAIYPQSDHKKISILVNLNTGAWTADPDSSFAKTSPARSMLLALQQFYGREV